MSPRDLLKLLMKQRGTNPTRLATVAGDRSIQTALSRWLSNPNYDIRPRTLSPVARVLGVPLEALLTQHAATQYAIENGLLPQQQTGDRSTALCGAIVSATQPRQEPLPLTKAIERTREALRKVPPGQRLEVTLQLLAQLGNDAVPPSTVAAGLEAAAAKRRAA